MPLNKKKLPQNEKKIATKWKKIATKGEINATNECKCHKIEKKPQKQNEGILPQMEKIVAIFFHLW